MPKVSVYNLEGQAVGEMELSDAVFGAPVTKRCCIRRSSCIWPTSARARRPPRPAARSGAAAASRGAKRAPAGPGTAASVRPIWVGGGVVFGPKPRDLSPVHAEEGPPGRDALGAVGQGAGRRADRAGRSLTLPEPKTKQMAAVLTNLSAERKPLIVLARARPQRGAVGAQPAGRRHDARRRT